MAVLECADDDARSVSRVRARARRILRFSDTAHGPRALLALAVLRAHRVFQARSLRQPLHARSKIGRTASWMYPCSTGRGPKSRWRADPFTEVSALAVGPGRHGQRKIEDVARRFHSSRESRSLVTNDRRGPMRSLRARAYRLPVQIGTPYRLRCVQRRAEPKVFREQADKQPRGCQHRLQGATAATPRCVAAASTTTPLVRRT